MHLLDIVECSYCHLNLQQGKSRHQIKVTNQQQSSA